MAICSVSDYKSWRNIAVTTWDTLIATLIAGGQARVEAYCGRLFDNTTRNQFIDGTGGATIQVQAYPITDITEITIFDHATNTALQTLVEDVDYYYNADLGLIYRTNAVRGRVGVAVYDFRGWQNEYSNVDWGVAPCWPEGYQNISIEYDGGYTTMPADLKLAFFEYLDQLWVKTWGGTLPTGLESEKIDKYEYKVGDPDANAVALQRGMFKTTALLTEYFGSWKRGDFL